MLCSDVVVHECAKRENWSVSKQGPDCLSPSVFSALFAPRMFAPRPGQKSPTALHDESSADKDKDDSINYTTVDWREFMCNTWHLEPTLRSAQHLFVIIRRTLSHDEQES